MKTIIFFILFIVIQELTMDNNQVKWAIRKRKVAAKRKLKEFQQVQDRQQKCRKKRREDECSKR